MTQQICIISDIHGCWFTLLRLLNAAPRGCRLVFAGDLIDRGPNSRAVIEFAITNGIPTTCGNHEDYAMAFYRHPGAHCAREYDLSYWTSHNGGDKTILNWPLSDANPPRARWQGQIDEHYGGRVPDSVLNWMAALPAWLTPSEELDENGRRLLVTHNGHGLNADEGSPADWFKALWARDTEFPDDGAFRVFGHTPVKQALVTESWATIDTGAAYTNAILSALLWPSKVVLTQAFDETPVKPTFRVVNGCIEDNPI